ncbi:MAG: hypothetical protein JNK17_10355 [Hydrogenophaga sp.]|nr:hypothetical protein [Hydrogenophaga sp.]
MWLLVAREPGPDAPQWAGRKSLAVLDAVAWPLLVVLIVFQSLVPLGVVGPLLAVAAFTLSVARLRRAIWLNHRYRFTTWRWGVVVLGLTMLGAALKILA